jgi:hypothetical protein
MESPNYKEKIIKEARDSIEPPSLSVKTFITVLIIVREQ